MVNIITELEQQKQTIIRKREQETFGYKRKETVRRKQGNVSRYKRKVTVRRRRENVSFHFNSMYLFVLEYRKAQKAQNEK